MSNIQKAEESVEQAKALLEKAMGQLAEAKKVDERVFGVTPKVGASNSYATLDGVACGGFGLLESVMSKYTNSNSDYYKGIFFESKPECDEFAKAMNTFLELRTMPGVAKPTQNCNLYSINYDKYRGYVEVLSWTSYAQICPFFKCKRSAEDALKVIGEDRIKHMYRVLSGEAKK